MHSMSYRHNIETSHHFCRLVCLAELSIELFLTSTYRWSLSPQSKLSVMMKHFWWAFCVLSHLLLKKHKNQTILGSLLALSFLAVHHFVFCAHFNIYWVKKEECHKFLPSECSSGLESSLSLWYGGRDSCTCNMVIL